MKKLESVAIEAATTFAILLAITFVGAAVFAVVQIFSGGVTQPGI